MSRVNKHCIVASMRRNFMQTPTNLVSILLPFHLSGIYAYLSGSLTIGAFMLVGLLALKYIK